MKPKLIKGGRHEDNRGLITFVNSFDLSPVKRFYLIEPSSIEDVRAWQGHRKEGKWFYCLVGSFEVKLVAVDNWTSPSHELEQDVYFLSEKESNVLFIPGGYANGFRAIEENSKLLVFSDKALEDSISDDYRFDKMYWGEW